jgi:hypothetical protein
MCGNICPSSSRRDVLADLPRQGGEFGLEAGVVRLQLDEPVRQGLEFGDGGRLRAVDRPGRALVRTTYASGTSNTGPRLGVVEALDRWYQ